MISAIGPVHPGPALMPNRLCDVEPSAFLISRWPQPDSCAAWATVNAAGMPLAASAHGFAQGLQRAGYATDPAYADKLARLINTTLRMQKVVS